MGRVFKSRSRIDNEVAFPIRSDYVAPVLISSNGVVGDIKLATRLSRRTIDIGYRYHL